MPAVDLEPDLACEPDLLLQRTKRTLCQLQVVDASFI